MTAAVQTLLDRAADSAGALLSAAEILGNYGNANTAHALRCHATNLQAAMVEAHREHQALLAERHEKASERRFTGEPITGFDESIPVPEATESDFAAFEESQR